MHDDYLPVLEWIISGEGRIVWGGTKYKEELKLASRFLKIFNELKKSDKICKIDDKIVDDHETIVKKLIKEHDFDDPHIAAIIRASGCRLVCTSDTRSIKYLKQNILYRKICKKPKFYTKKSNASLLIKKNIGNCCMPIKIVSQEQKSILKKLFDSLF
ncbi:MAG: hypothetical protein Q8L04_02300 [Ignavibacteria bacterium]|nr:hypothetical protein [Ignavibacteria bacterium]